MKGNVDRTKLGPETKAGPDMMLSLDTTKPPTSVFKIKTGIMAGKPLGDAVANLTHLTGLEKVAETYTRVTGRDCGCERRHEFLNNLSI